MTWTCPDCNRENADGCGWCPVCSPVEHATRDPVAPDPRDAEIEKLTADLAATKAMLEGTLTVLRKIEIGACNDCSCCHSLRTLAGLAIARLDAKKKPPKITRDEAAALVKNMRADPDLDARLRETFTAPDNDLVLCAKKEPKS